MKQPRKPRKPKDRGAALVLVLWGAVVMSIIAAAAARQASMSAVVVNASSELTRARALADGGVRAGWTAFADRQIDKFTALWGCRNGEDLLLVKIRPESARVDINMASEGMLAALFRAGGANERTASELAAAAIDYREFGNEDEGGGAQVVEGTARIPEGTFRRGAFQTIEELGYLPGMDATLFRAIADDITTDSRTTDIDMENASALVRKAFNDAASENSGSVTRQAAVNSEDAAYEGSMMAVRTIAVTPSGAVFARESVVEGPFDAQGTPKVLRLVQSSLRANERIPDGSDAPPCSQGFKALIRFE